MKRIATCCFTGHRPEKLNIPRETAKKLLETAIEAAFSDGFTEYITGMARGIDIWAAEIVLELQKEFPYVRLICAIPFEGFEKGWEKAWKEKYIQILHEADEIHYISEEYSREVFQKRNEWMVEQASLVIACYNGEAGGTRNTLKYAEKQNISIRNVFF